MTWLTFTLAVVLLVTSVQLIRATRELKRQDGVIAKLRKGVHVPVTTRECPHVVPGFNDPCSRERGHLGPCW